MQSGGGKDRGPKTGSRSRSVDRVKGRGKCGMRGLFVWINRWVGALRRARAFGRLMLSFAEQRREV